MPASPLSGALAALSNFLVADASLGDTLRRVADITAGAVPNARFVGMTMLDDREGVTTAVFTDEQSPRIDQAQYDSGRGPCLDSWRIRGVVRLDDIEADGRAAYPEFADACLEHGVRSTLSFPLEAGERGVGAMNLYGAEEGAFTADDERLGGDLATAASVVLANAVAYWGAFDLGQQLTEAMASRATIEQAKGMLMASMPELTADDAFELLRKASQRENVKLREIALRIVERKALSLSE